jgi:hypothetical protein
MLAQIRRQGRKCKRPPTSNQRLNHFVSNHLVIKARPTNRSLQSWGFTCALHLGVPQVMLHYRGPPFGQIYTMRQSLHYNPLSIFTDLFFAIRTLSFRTIYNFVTVPRGIRRICASLQLKI